MTHRRSLSPHLDSPQTFSQSGLAGSPSPSAQRPPGASTGISLAAPITAPPFPNPGRGRPSTPRSPSRLGSGPETAWRPPSRRARRPRRTGRPRRPWGWVRLRGTWRWRLGCRRSFACQRASWHGAGPRPWLAAAPCSSPASAPGVGPRGLFWRRPGAPLRRFLPGGAGAKP
jgi:hypothetical protein